MKKQRLTAAGVEDLLRQCRGNLAWVGRRLGVSRQAVWKFVGKRPALKEVAVDLREEMKDFVENQLYEAALRGEPWAVVFYLKTQAKDRGTTTRVETHKGVTDEQTAGIVRAALGALAPDGQPPGQAPRRSNGSRRPGKP